MTDEFYMREAVREAKKAFDADEVPIGCVIVWNDRIIARAFNRTEQLKDFTAHAEMQAFTSASDYLNNKYLNECTIYVTLEPCAMCSGAAFWTQLGRIVFGASDIKRGVSAISGQILHPSTQGSFGSWYRLVHTTTDKNHQTPPGSIPSPRYRPRLTHEIPWLGGSNLNAIRFRFLEFSPYSPGYFNR